MSNPASNTASILQKNKKVLIASLTGSAIEWFDYFLYGTAAALVFNKIFFPMVDPVIGLILSWLSFSLTFFIRPIGGVIFAHIGDRIGRKKTLVLTLSLMGSATVAIGLLPTYEMVGLWAPALLITLRIIQGMGIGGEWGGAAPAAGLRIRPGKAERLFRQYSPGRRDHRHADGNLHRLADDPVR
jgi:MFS family permease